MSHKKSNDCTYINTYAAHNIHFHDNDQFLPITIALLQKKPNYEIMYLYLGLTAVYLSRFNNFGRVARSVYQYMYIFILV